MAEYVVPCLEGLTHDMAAFGNFCVVCGVVDPDKLSLNAKNRLAPGTKVQRQIKMCMERDGFRCFYCHIPAIQVDGIWFATNSHPMSRDHVHPRSKGGGSALANLVACCRRCNVTKGDDILVCCYGIWVLEGHSKGPYNEIRRHALIVPLDWEERYEEIVARGGEVRIGAKRRSNPVAGGGDHGPTSDLGIGVGEQRDPGPADASSVSGDVGLLRSRRLIPTRTRDEI